jgi:hypothetical protein
VTRPESIEHASTGFLQCNLNVSGPVGSWRLTVTVEWREDGESRVRDAPCDVLVNGGAPHHLLAIHPDGALPPLYSCGSTPAFHVMVCDAAGNYLPTPVTLGKIRMSGPVASLTRLEGLAISNNVSRAVFQPVALSSKPPKIALAFEWRGLNQAGKTLSILPARVDLEVRPVPGWIKQLTLTSVDPDADTASAQGGALVLQRGTTARVLLDVAASFDDPRERLGDDVADQLQVVVTLNGQVVLVPAMQTLWTRSEQQQGADGANGSAAAAAAAAAPTSPPSAANLRLELSTMDLSAFPIGSRLELSVQWLPASMDEAHRARLRQSQLDLSRSVKYVIGDGDAVRLAIRGSSDVAAGEGYSVDWQRMVWRLQLLTAQGDVVPGHAMTLQQGRDAVQAMRVELASCAAGSTCARVLTTQPVEIGERKFVGTADHPLQVSKLTLAKPHQGQLEYLRFYFGSPFDHLGACTVHFSSGRKRPPSECPILRRIRHENQLARTQIEQRRTLLRQIEEWLDRHAVMFEARAANAPWQLRPWQLMRDQAQQRVEQGPGSQPTQVPPFSLPVLRSSHQAPDFYFGRLSDFVPPMQDGSDDKQHQRKIQRNATHARSVAHSFFFFFSCVCVCALRVCSDTSRALSRVAGSLSMLTAHVFHHRHESAQSTCGRLLALRHSDVTAVYVDQIVSKVPAADQPLWTQFGGFSLFHRIWRRMEMQWADEEQQQQPHAQSQPRSQPPRPREAWRAALIRVVGSTLVFPTLAQGSAYAERSRTQNIPPLPVYGIAEDRMIRGGVEQTGAPPAVATVGVCSDEAWAQLCLMERRVRMVPPAQRHAAEAEEHRGHIARLQAECHRLEEMRKEHEREPCTTLRCVRT